ncbi:hypothetical protein [Dokdonella sp.]|uniref:hypothetical protein n=1 Tax=Dokdonella sp. TaxID=2291710 RepID=UPI001B2ACAFE|nr:hypothetical protein [Dokdonella sp.]MBO9664701.1 hypothetical protein [Dokdonella sp.]
MRNRLRSLPSLVFVLSSASSLAANGDLDPTFGVGGTTTAGVSQAGLQLPVAPVVMPDGRILTCAPLGANGPSGTDFLVVRYLADGGLDTSFSFDGKVTVDFGGSNDQCNAIALQSDGKIVVVGSTNAAGNSDFAIARLNADGTLDTSFGNGTGKVVVAFDNGGTNADIGGGIAIQPDGKLVAVGMANSASNGDDFAIVRLLPDGTRDPAFNLTGRVIVGFDFPASSNKTDEASSVAVDPAGRILVGGVAQTVGNGLDFAVARLLPNGQLDADFDGDGRATIGFDLGASGNDLCYRMLLRHDGRIVLIGAADTSSSSAVNNDMAVARLMPDGSPDVTFGIGGKTVLSFDLIPNGADGAFAGVEQSNGKLIIGGIAQHNLSPLGMKGALARLNADGSLDGQFGTFGKVLLDFERTSPSQQFVLGLALQGTQIIATGVVTIPGAGDPPPQDVYVARLQNDLIFADGFD